MSRECESGDSYTDFDGGREFADCHDAATFRWGPEGDSYSLFCDRHLLKAMIEEVSDNLPEDMFQGQLVILNDCCAPGCTKEAMFEHTSICEADLFRSNSARYCDEHSLQLTPYWDTVKFIDPKTVPYVLQEG